MQFRDHESREKAMVRAQWCSIHISARDLLVASTESKPSVKKDKNRILVTCYSNDIGFHADLNDQDSAIDIYPYASIHN